MRYSKDQIEYVREIAPGRYNQEIVELFNAKFGTNATENQIRNIKTNRKIRSNVPRKRVTEDDGLFTKEQKDFIRAHAKGVFNQNLSDLVNDQFNLSTTAQQIKTWKRNHGLSSGLRGSEGMAPPNKGTVGLHNVGGNETSFKPGQRPLNYKPVGSERICSKDGYVIIKVQDVGPWQKRWRPKHKVLWEAEHGPVPKGHILLFLDGNKLNLSLDNLELITRSQLAVLNKNGLLQANADLNKLAIMIADLKLKISEKQKEA